MIQNLRTFPQRGLQLSLRRRATRKSTFVLGTSALAYCGTAWLSSHPTRSAALHCQEPQARKKEQPHAPMFRFRFCGKPETFTLLYEACPSANSASVNAGDNRLYVGGGAINLAFAKVLRLAEQNGYQELHVSMLKAAQNAPGQLQISGDAEAAALRELGLLGCFARMPVGSTRAQGSAGAVFISIFTPEHRPSSEANVAMVYTVGPRGQGASGPKGQSVETCSAFLSAVEDMAANVMLALREYNKHASALEEVGTRCDLPLIEIVQFCLVSGGVYRHPEASKADVGSAIVRGLVAGSCRQEAGSSRFVPVVRFAYDEGAFEEAVQTVIFSGDDPEYADAGE